MKSIGGFYELELPQSPIAYHADAIALSTGRACLRLMIRHLDIRKCYVPYYTCDAVFHPFVLEAVPMEEYSIDGQFEPQELPALGDGEYFLYINYFGVKSDTVAMLLERYGERLIVDNTHLFFHKGYPQNWSFTSARKYFGVPDGAYLYAPVPVTERPARFEEISISHNFSRLMGRQQQAHAEYTAYEKSLDAEIHGISLLTERMLSVVDFEMVQQRRLSNYRYLHGRLGHLNTFRANASITDAPFAYPLIPEEAIEKQGLYDRGFFVPALWADPLNRVKPGYDSDLAIARKLLPLPIDHRYLPADLEPMADYLLSVLKK